MSTRDTKSSGFQIDIYAQQFLNTPIKVKESRYIALFAVSRSID